MTPAKTHPLGRNTGRGRGLFRPSAEKMGRCLRRPLLASIVTLSLLLSGCASLLERDYTSVTPHNTAPATE